MKVFTTGQAAKICKVSPQVVCRWFDSGRLKGYRIPGSQDRRIPRANLIRFLKENNMPFDDLEDETMAKVLIVSQDEVLIGNLQREMTPEQSFKVAVVANNFEVGTHVNSFLPDCIVVDFSIGNIEAALICKNIRGHSDYSGVIVIAVLPDDTPSSFDRRTVHETFRKPFDAYFLAERVRTIVGAKKDLV
ncbi:MAG: helix-turn-helix domain-containing protein [Candidatus Peribacteraceae bacterium]|jgi:excisionase family DNA binding protein